MGQTCSGDEKRRISANEHGFCYRQDPLRPQRYQLCFKQKPVSSFGLLVPLYGTYEANKDLWAACIDASNRGVAIVCLLRPALDDTPLQFADLAREYIDGVAALNAAGVRCVGYIETARCSKNMWLINNEIEAFATWSTHLLCGIFFDHTAMDEGSYSVGYCRQAAQMTRVHVGPLVIFNPGNVPLSLDYRKWANIVVTFEDRYVFFKPRPQDVPATRIYTRKIKDKRKNKDDSAPARSDDGCDETNGEEKLDGQSEAYRPGMSAGEKVKSDVEMAGLALRGYRSLIDDDDDDALDGSASEWEHDDNPRPRAAAAAAAAAATAPAIQLGVDPEVGGTVAAIADKVRENGAMPGPAENDSFFEGAEAANLTPVAPLGAVVLALGQGLQVPVPEVSEVAASEAAAEGAAVAAAVSSASSTASAENAAVQPETASAPSPIRELTQEEELLVAKVNARVAQRARRSLRLARSRGFGWVYLTPRAALLTPEGEQPFDKACWDTMIAAALEETSPGIPSADATLTADNDKSVAETVEATEAADGDAAVLVACNEDGSASEVASGSLGNDAVGNGMDALASIIESSALSGDALPSNVAANNNVSATTEEGIALTVETPDVPRW